MMRNRMVLSTAVVMALAACATQGPRTQAELQQQRAEVRADDARDVADTHKAANKEVKQAQDTLRKAENEAIERDASAHEGRVQEAKARARATAAPGEARERIRTAEVEARYRLDRQNCEALAEASRASCMAAADERLNSR